MLTATERFTRALARQDVDHPPVWLMRQAGRYLPEYREIKTKHPTIQMMRTPEIACEITLQPVRRLGVDAAILYSDILMIPDALGMGLSFQTGEGPKFAFAANSADAIAKLNRKNLNERMSFVFETVRRCVKELPAGVPLLGFAGAPFTVACYMIAGGSSPTDFAEVKAFAWQEPKLFTELLDLLADATVDYLLEQKNAGVLAVQLFDTWSGLLSAEDYGKLAWPWTEKVFAALKKHGVMTMHYAKASAHLLPQFAKLSCDALSLDWRMSFATAQKLTDGTKALQGNLDPDVLLANKEVVIAKTQAMLASVPNARCGYIANVGHGVSQHTPVENVQAFVKTVQSFK